MNHSDQLETANPNPTFSPAFWKQILAHLTLGQLASIRLTSQLFNAVYQEAQQVESRRLRCNFINLPSEIWVHEIMTRLKRDDLKKIEVICKIFKQYINQQRSLSSQLFGGQVVNKNLLSIYQEPAKPVSRSSSSSSASSVVSTRFSSTTSSKVSLNPILTQASKLKCCISRDRSGYTFADLYVNAFGKDEYRKVHFKKPSDMLLERHPIGREAASEPAVGWFRFDFEQEGKTHRGTSGRFPASNGKPKAVTVNDVMSCLVKLKGEKDMARWYNSRYPREARNEKDSTFTIEFGMKGKLVKKGNSVGLEVSDASFSDDTEFDDDEDDGYNHRDVVCWSCGGYGHKKYQCNY